LELLARLPLPVLPRLPRRERLPQEQWLPAPLHPQPELQVRQRQQAALPAPWRQAPAWFLARVLRLVQGCLSVFS